MAVAVWCVWCVTLWRRGVYDGGGGGGGGSGGLCVCVLHHCPPVERVVQARGSLVRAYLCGICMGACEQGATCEAV